MKLMKLMEIAINFIDQIIDTMEHQNPKEVKYSELSRKLTTKLNKKEKKNNGIYFTPPDFKICVSRAQTYKQAGNAMSINVVCFILKSLLMGVNTKSE